MDYPERGMVEDKESVKLAEQGIRYGNKIT
jgi:hypothetical protein